MINIVHISHKITMDVICLLENQNQTTICHLITNNDLVYCKRLSYMYTCVCLVTLLICDLFNFRVKSNYNNFGNLHKQDKVAGLKARPHTACNYLLTEPN